MGHPRKKGAIPDTVAPARTTVTSRRQPMPSGTELYVSVLRALNFGFESPQLFSFQVSALGARDPRRS
jgi:hypothetical protein